MKYSFLFIIALLLILSCGDGDDPPPNTGIVAVSAMRVEAANGSVKFSSRLENTAKKDVAYGFVWSRYTDQPVIGWANVIPLGSTSAPSLDFEKVMPEDGFTVNEDIYVRAYATVGSLTNYSPRVSYRRGLKPIIHSISPTKGRAGTFIYITGDQFYYGATVYFNSTIAWNTWVYSNTDIQVQVPAGLPDGEITISVDVSGNRAYATQKFTVIRPKIVSITPLEGTFNDEITIRGTGLKADDTYTNVEVGGTYAQITHLTDTLLKIKVPTEVNQESSRIAVTVGERVISEQEFVVLPPEITDIQPREGDFNEVITITGRNFHPYSYRNRITIGGVEVTPSESSSTRLKFQVPPNYHGEEGRSPVTLTIMRQIEGGEFQLKPPLIQSMSPTDGVRGTKIEIKGEHFNPWTANNAVTVGGLPAQVVSSNTNMILVNVPDGLARGEHEVKIGVGGYEVLSPHLFRFSDPWVVRSQIPGGARADAFAFSIGGYGYAGGGLGTNDQVKSDFYMYDPASDTWTRKADIPVGGAGVCSFATASYGYAIKNKELWRYNPATNKWTSMADFPGSALRRQSAFVVDNKAYVAFGEVSTWESTSQIHEYDEGTDTWTYRGSLGFTSVSSVAMSDGQNGFFALGNLYYLYRYSPQNSNFTTESYLYNQLGSNTNRYGGLGVSAPGKVYFGAGLSNWSYSIYADFYEYVPATGTLTRLSDMPGGGRQKSFAFYINGKVYVGAGITSMSPEVRSSDFYEFDPEYDGQ